MAGGMGSLFRDMAALCRRARGVRVVCFLALAVASLASHAQETSTSLSSSLNPSVLGQSVSFKATVSGSINSKATITVRNGATTLATLAIKSGGATYSTSALVVGTHSITATYNGAGTSQPSTSAPLVQTVNPKPASATTTTLTLSPTSTLVGKTVSFSAAVTGTSPTGAVTFKSGETSLGTATLAASGKTRTAKLITTVPGGTHAVTAHYAGDPNNAPSVSAAATLTVSRAASAVSVASSVNPSAYAQAINLSATVTGSGTPSGPVTFKSGGADIGTANVGAGGVAVLAVSSLAADSHTISAAYAGDANNQPSSSASITQVVNKATTGATLASSRNPAGYGQPVTLTATITGGASPTGSVTFKDGAAVLGTGTLSAGVASFTTAQLAIGSHTLTASYGGDANHQGGVSAALSQSIGSNPSTTTLSATPATAALNEPVVLVATVNGTNATGNVTFHDGGVALGTASLSNGSASLIALSLAEGTHMLTASYAGDAANGPSTSVPVAVSIAPQGGSVWQYEYDAMGRLTKATDPNQLATRIRYDKLGRAIQTEQPASTLINFGYDTANNLTSVVDPRQLTTSYVVSGLGSVKAQASPDSGNTSYTYDSQGQLQSATDARSKQASYAYDEIGRLTRISYPTGTASTFEYDGGPVPVPGAIGKLTKMTDESGQTTYSYDAMGRMTGKTVTIGARTFTVAYGWGDSGLALDKLTSITYPGGSRVNYGYDATGEVNAITVNPVNANGTGVDNTAITLMTNITYNVDGNVTGWQWSDGKPRTIGYDVHGNVTSYSLGDPAGVGKAAGVNRVVVRDAAGRIRAYTHSGAGAMQGALDQVFGYDSLNRLTAATIGNVNTSYTYDATGNRTSKTIGGTTYTNTIAGNSNRLTQAQDTQGTASIVHDAAGNITSDGTNTYAYNDRGRMTSATTASGLISFKYNGLEQRASKVGTTATYYVYDEDGQLLGEYDSNGSPVYETAYLGMAPVGVLKQTGSAANSNLAVTLHNVYADQIATPRVITKQDHTLVWRWDAAEAFGASGPDQNPGGAGVFVYNQRFPGQVADGETGLNQNWHREYSARIGRYIQTDPAGLAGGHLYTYVENAPLNLADPKGLWSVSFEGYAGLGGGFTITCSDGKLEITSRVGAGKGGGLGFDPKGTVSPHANGSAGAIVRTYVTAGAEASIPTMSVGASVTWRSGNAAAMKNGGDYTEITLPQYGAGVWRPKLALVAAMGVEFGGYIDLNSLCACK